jgi:DNA-binding transcriptional MocR family regulator
MSQRLIRGTTAAAIAASAESAIDTGALAAGARMPTIRELAAGLRVSPVTVTAAYKLLRARGLLVSDGRRGTRVRQHPPTSTAYTALRRVDDDLIDLANGNPDPALLPRLGTALHRLDPESPLYGTSPQLAALMTFAAADFAADGIDAGALTVTGGALDAIERILGEFVRPGDRVAVEDPTLPGLLELLRVTGVIAEPIPLDAEGVLPGPLDRALRRRVRALIVTPRGQNPTGAAMSPGRAHDVTRVLRGYRDVLVMENDATGPVSGVPAITLCDPPPPHWAVVRSTSAFLGPDLRLALVAGDALTIARVRARQALGTRWVSRLLQQLALALWSDPSSGRMLARASEVYAARRTALIDALTERGIPSSGRSGFNVWVPVVEETATVQALARCGWAVAPGERFRIASPPGIRITTSALVPGDALRLAADLAAAVRP